MEEKKLVAELVEIGKDNTSCVYSYVTGRISAIVRSNANTAEEKVEEIRVSLQCMDEALKEIAKVREGA